MGDLENSTTGDDFGHEKLEAMLGETGQRLELSRRQFFGLLRTAVSGRNVSPPLFETMEVMGRDSGCWLACVWQWRSWVRQDSSSGPTIPPPP